MKKQFFFFLLVTQIIAACKSESTKPNEPQQPNVILIMADDQGYGDFSCHGNPVVQTPNLDKLHGQSVRLTDFHVAPMCTPTRGQLMTGVDAMRNGATAVCQGRSMVREELRFMPEYFAEAGYQTGHFGKWHLGDSYPFRPQDRGFQNTIHHPAWGITSIPDHFENTYWNPRLLKNGEEVPFEGYCTDIFFREAMDWMKAQKESEKPFFVYLPTNTPHVPNWVDEEYAAPYNEIGTYEGKKVPSNFYGMIANLDQNIGKLQQFLKQEGLTDNTILIYLTDNGTQSALAADIYNAGMKGNKTMMYEGGHRVACFIRWNDGELLHGRDISELTQVQDLLPTLGDMCGFTPKDYVDGTSLYPLLTGKVDQLGDRKLVIQYSFLNTSAEKWERSIVMWDKWRLLGEEELYNVEKDPAQQENIAGDHPEIVAQMKEHYASWYAITRPQYDRIRHIHLGNAAQNPLMLYSNDWQGGYCDNPGNLLEANTTGFWDVEVDAAGEYRIELRRWPEESGLRLSEGVRGEELTVEHEYSGVVGARPIAYANLNIQNFSDTVAVETSDSFAAFTVDLPEGPSKLQTFFLDENKDVLCSAIYVKVEKL